MSFGGFIAACFVIARRFRPAHNSAGIASGAICASVILVFTAAVVLGWTWISAMQLQLAKEVRA